MWEPTQCPRNSPSSRRIPSWDPCLQRGPTPGPGAAASTSFLPAVACPPGQVFVNCSDLHIDPGLSRERTCEQQLLNLSVPVHGPCLSGCACPQGYGPMSSCFLLFEGWQSQEPWGGGWGMGGRDNVTQPNWCRLAQGSCDASGKTGKEQEPEGPAWDGFCPALLLTSCVSLDEELL
jgi:hypothetical protein